MLIGCAERLKGQDYYIPELEIYLKFEKIQSKKARVYFSRTKEFTTDYVDYTYYPDGPCTDIYYLVPNKLYVIDGGEITETESKHFDISVINDYTNNHSWRLEENQDSSDSSDWNKKAYVRAMKDSVFIKEPHYLFEIIGVSYFVVFDSNNLIFNSYLCDE